MEELKQEETPSTERMEQSNKTLTSTLHRETEAGVRVCPEKASDVGGS